MQRIRSAFAFAAASLLPSAASAEIARIDTAFATDGFAFYRGAASEMRTVAHLPRSDGTSLAVLAYEGASCPRTCVALALFADDGTALAQANVDQAANFTDLAAAALDAQDRIVVVGSVDLLPNDSDFVIVRLTADGQLDPTFSQDGIAQYGFDFGGDNVDTAHAVAIDAANRIVVAGGVERNATMDVDFGLLRLRPDGSLDPTFDDDGRRAVAFDLTDNPTDVATAVAIADDGRILVAGTVRDFDVNVLRMGIARLTTAGALDASWCPSATPCNFSDYPGIADGRRVIYFGNVGDARTHTLSHMAVNAAGAIVTTGTQRGVDGISGFVNRFAADGNWTNEVRIDGGETDLAASASTGGVHWVDPAAAESDVIVTGTYGIGENLFFVQRLTPVLDPLANWGSSGPANSVVAYSPTNGFTGDPDVDVPGLSSLDGRGRVLLAGAVKTPLSSDPYSAMVGRLTNPLLLFDDGFED